MIKYQNDCSGCEIPCIDCGRRHTPHLCCDGCGNETDRLSRLAGYESYYLCDECYADFIESVTVRYDLERMLGMEEE